MHHKFIVTAISVQYQYPKGLLGLQYVVDCYISSIHVLHVWSSRLLLALMFTPAVMMTEMKV